MAGSSYKKKRMIMVNIKIEKNGEYIFYTVYGNNSKMCTVQWFSFFFFFTTYNVVQPLRFISLVSKPF